MGYEHSPIIYFYGFSFYYYYLMSKLIPKMSNIYQIYFLNQIVFISIFHQKVEFGAL